METPTVIDESERERERVDSSGSFPLPAGRQAHRHKILFGVIVTIGILLYAAFNVWVYRNATSSKGLSSPAAIRQAVPSPGTGFNGLKGDSTPPAEQDPAPRDTPRPTGPGQYACDEYGICNNYEDSKRVGCPQTFADSRCLDTCGDQKVRCLKPK